MFVFYSVSGVFIVGYLLLQLVNSRSFQFFGGIVSSVQTDKKVVALTFDDGPSQSTAEVLDIVNSLRVPATFYLIGENIEQEPALSKEIANSGYEIGNHSLTHQRMIFKSYAFVQNEIETTDELIRSLGYEGPITFRPPYFKKLLTLPMYLHERDRKTILADVTPEDDKDVAGNTEKIIEYTLEHVQPGSIILLHPHYENTASRAAIEPIVKELRQQGYEFVTVSELLST